MDGIVNVLKPPGMTSHDVVYFIRKAFKTKKVGHTGTLDPEAAGVLPVCINKATKAVEYFMDKNKHYRANIKFGIETETGDSYGKAIRTCEVGLIDKEELKQVISTFIGTIEQTPPIYSAIKYNGKKLYEYAREGQSVEIESRTVEIYKIELIDFISPDEVMIDVYCGKGTYIRSLCRDIGEKLGCCAHMSQLVRLESEPFRIENSVTLEEIKAAELANQLEALLIPVDQAFSKFPVITVKDSARNSALSGNFLYKQGLIEDLDQYDDDKYVRIYEGQDFIGIGVVKYNEEENRKYLRIKKLFNLRVTK